MVWFKLIMLIVLCGWSIYLGPKANLGRESFILRALVHGALAVVSAWACWKYELAAVIVCGLWMTCVGADIVMILESKK